MALTLTSIVVTLALISAMTLLLPSLALVIAIVVLINFLLIWGYHIIFEALFRGRTLGHMAAGLRATRIDGGRIGVFAATIRGLFWTIEVLSFPFVAVVAVFASPRNQRLGDMAAGTIVIYDERAPLRPRATLQPAALDPNAPFQTWDVSRITPNDTAVIRSFIERRNEIQYGARVHIASSLATRIQPLVTGAPSNWHPESFLEGIVAAKAQRD